jgi:hypothetical protein
MVLRQLSLWSLRLFHQFTVGPKAPMCGFTLGGRRTALETVFSTQLRQRHMRAIGRSQAPFLRGISPIYGVEMRWVGGSGDAEDLAQSTKCRTNELRQSFGSSETLLVLLVTGADSIQYRG